MRAATIQDVAHAANVSVSTVSRVARDHADVNEHTREHVLRTIQELGYRPSPIARALVSGRSQLLALLVSDIANPFYPQLAKSIEREAKRHGYGVIMCNTDDDAGETRHYIERVLDHGIDGIIHASVGDDEELVLDLVDDLDRIVFVNRRPRNEHCNYVVSDNAAGAAELTRHLLHYGHRRIGFVGGPDFASNARERLAGFLRAMESHAATEPLVAHGDFSPESGAQAARDWLSTPAPPSAIVAVNDSVALGILEVVLSAGLSIPDDVAIAGFDDISLASSHALGLTTVAQHIDQTGSLAVRGLLRLLAGPSGAHHVQRVLRPTLLVRRTTAPTPRPSREDECPNPPEPFSPAP